MELWMFYGLLAIVNIIVFVSLLAVMTHNEDFNVGLLTLIGVCFTIYFVLSMSTYTSSKDAQLKEDINSAIDSGYEIYINGNLVDADNIDIDQYLLKVTIDDEKRKIMIVN